MKKFNEFCEKYYAPLLCLVAALWFFVDYFFAEIKLDSLIWSGVFWIVFAIEEFIRANNKSKKK